MDEDSRIEARKREAEEGDADGSWIGTALALGGVGVVLAVVGYVILSAGGTDPVSVDTGDWSDVAPGDGPEPTLVAADGSTRDDAVTVVYYGDFQCPHCRDFEASSFPRLKEDYIASGDVEFVFRPVNLESTEGWARNSRAAALGSRCVWERNRTAYWRWHTAVFASQARYDQRWATPSSLGDIAADVGMDGDAIASCIEDETYVEEYRENERAFEESGIGSTPGFSVEGDHVTGNVYGRLSATIDAHLDEGSGEDGENATAANGTAA